MKKLLFSIVLLSSICIAEEPWYNKKYSFKNFMNMVMTDALVTELNGTVIIGSCFYQENVPNRVIFPPLMTGVTFKRCNLVNVFIPPGNTVITTGDDACLIGNVMVQNDLSDWKLDFSLKPTEPLDKEKRVDKGISIDPKDIPTEKQDENVFTKKEKADEKTGK